MKTIAIDVETTSNDPRIPAFNPWRGHRVFAVAVGDQFHRTQDLKFINELNPARWVGHNIKFDARFLHHHGVQLEGKLVDTRVLDHLVHEEEQHDLKNAARRHLKGDWPEDEAVKSWLKAAKTKDYGELPDRLVEPYCQADADRAKGLALVLPKKLDRAQRRLWRIEIKLTRVLLDAELRGVKVDVPKLKQAQAGYTALLFKAVEELREIAGWDVDPTVHKEVVRLITDTLNLPVMRVTAKHGRPSFDHDALKLYQSDEGLTSKQRRAASLLIACARADKLITGFLIPWRELMDADGVLHPEFNQVGTRTGRLSCSRPNMQQITKRLKPLFIARDGYLLLYMDYSQIEYRFFAHYARDARVFAAYRENPNIDFHQFVADMIGINRDRAKTINFGLLYGMGVAKLAASLGLSLEKADNLLRSYHHEFISVRPLTRMCSNVAKRRGYVHTLYGRRRHLRDFPFKALNSICQGGAGDLAKIKMVEVAEQYPEAKLLIGVHDELVWEVPERGAEALAVELRKILEDVPELDVPVRVHWALGRRWE